MDVERTGKPSAVGNHLGNDLGIWTFAGPLPADGAAEGFGRLFAAFYALSYPSILKLEGPVLKNLVFLARAVSVPQQGAYQEAVSVNQDGNVWISSLRLRAVSEPNVSFSASVCVCRLASHEE